MKFFRIFRFEFAYQAGKISTWLYLIVLLIYAIGMKLLIATGDGVYPNNTLHITGMTVIGGLIWLIMGASVAGEAAARDLQMRIHPLVYTSSVKKLNYLGGKFLAAYAVNALIIFALPLGVLLSFYFPGLEYITGREQEELLPFRPVAYLNVYFLIALPFAFVATTLQFAFAALSRQVMASYIASLLLAILAQIIAVAIAKLFGNWDLIKLLDPVGIVGILNSELGTWTAAEKNTRLILLEGMFLWNRILWLIIAAGLLWFTYHRFSFTNPVNSSWLGRYKRRSKLGAVAPAETGMIRATAISVPKVRRSFGMATNLRQTISIAWVSFKVIARHPIGLSLIGLMALTSAIFGQFIINEMGIQLHPTTGQVIAYFSAPVSNIGSPWVIIPLLIMYFAGLLIWRERDSGISEIADAAPVKDWVLFIGKILGLGLVIAAWMAILMAGGILMQVILDAGNIDSGLYFRVLFGFQLLDYLLFALLAFVVHIVVNHKYIGFLVVLMIFSFMALPSKFGVEHKMLIYGADPGWWYTDMRGFGPTPGPWLWFKAYWIAWALLLAVAARLLWVRGKEARLNSRLQVAKRRFKGSTIGVTAIGAVLLVSVGSFIFYNTNVLNTYLTSSDIIERQAQYEILYSRYRNIPQPHLTTVRLNIELNPDKQQAGILGTYTFVNKDTIAIDSIHVGSAWGIELSEIKFDRQAVEILKDHEHNHHIYALEQSLEPGDSLQFSFAVNYLQQGFQNNGTKPLVVENGTYFTNFDLLPGIGYHSNREIKDPVLRKKHNLAARPEIPLLNDPEARKIAFSSDQISLEVIIGTTKDELAVAPGILQRVWTERDRRYYHYKTDGPIGGEYRILSADYNVKESTWNDVAINIYFPADHSQNIDRMLKSAQASLEYFSEQFGPYPFISLTLVEGAGNGAGASADAGIIYYGEQYALMNPDDSPNGFDLPYYIMAHEVAHQWWGNARLSPAYVEGAGLLIEGLSVYSGMQVLEKTYGKSHLQKYVNYLHSSYAIPRSLAAAPLLHANEQFLYYKKGGLAMYTLSKYIGKEKVNTALRNLLEKRESGDLFLPTSLDLYQELKQVTPDSLDYLLNDLFKKNTYWRLKTEQIKAKQTKAGSWEVTMIVNAQKFVVDNTGKEKIVPMDEWLEVGIYEKNKEASEPLYLQKHRIRSGEQTIKVIVPKKPGSGGIDPNYLMIDVRLQDNIKKLNG